MRAVAGVVRVPKWWSGKRVALELLAAAARVVRSDLLSAEDVAAVRGRVLGGLRLVDGARARYRARPRLEQQQVPLRSSTLLVEVLRVGDELRCSGGTSHVAHDRAVAELEQLLDRLDRGRP